MTRDQVGHADLGLGYPPVDDTEDLRVAFENRPLDSKKPPNSTAKHQFEGIRSTNQQEEDLP